MTASKSERAGDRPPPDDLNTRIGVLTRREVEARILGPIIEALSADFGLQRVLEVVGEAIVRLAQTQGAELAEAMGGNSSSHLMESLQFWTQDNALEIEVLEHSEERLSFNVTRCRYAELYRALGMAELGATLSCNRDFALVEGFNPHAALQRTQTIMERAPYCDFRFTFRFDDDATNPDAPLPA